MCVQPICWEKTANRVHANEERRGVKSMRLNERKAVTCYTPAIAERLQSIVTESCETCTGIRYWTHVCVWHTCTHLCSKDIILIGNHANKGKYMHSAHGRIVTINLCVCLCVSPSVYCIMYHFQASSSGAGKLSQCERDKNSCLTGLLRLAPNCDSTIKKPNFTSYPPCMTTVHVCFFLTYPQS